MTLIETVMASVVKADETSAPTACYSMHRFSCAKVNTKYHCFELETESLSRFEEGMLSLIGSKNYHSNN